MENTQTIEHLLNEITKAVSIISLRKLSEEIIMALENNDRSFNYRQQEMSLLKYLKEKGNLYEYLKNIYKGSSEKSAHQSFYAEMIKCIRSIRFSYTSNISFKELIDLVPNKDKNIELKECLFIANSYFLTKAFEVGIEIEYDSQEEKDKNNNRLFKNIASNYLKKGALITIFTENINQIQARGLTATSFLHAKPIWITVKNYNDKNNKTLADKKELTDHWSNVEPLFSYLKMKSNPHPIRTMVVVPLCVTNSNYKICSPFGFISFESEELTFPEEATKDAFKRLAEIISESLLEESNSDNSLQ